MTMEIHLNGIIPEKNHPAISHHPFRWDYPWKVPLYIIIQLLIGLSLKKTISSISRWEYPCQKPSDKGIPPWQWETTIHGFMTGGLRGKGVDLHPLQGPARAADAKMKSCVHCCCLMPFFWIKSCDDSKSDSSCQTFPWQCVWKYLCVMKI